MKTSQFNYLVDLQNSGDAPDLRGKDVDLTNLFIKNIIYLFSSIRII